MPQLNDKAPLFELKNTNKESVSLSDHIGKPIVLAFSQVHIREFVIQKCAHLEII